MRRTNHEKHLGDRAGPETVFLVLFATTLIVIGLPRMTFPQQGGGGHDAVTLPLSGVEAFPTPAIHSSIYSLLRSVDYKKEPILPAHLLSKHDNKCGFVKIQFLKYSTYKDSA